MKSGSASKAPGKAPKWTLRKSLARKVSFRPLEEEDLKYVWAAYRQGSFAYAPGMSAGEFDEFLRREVIPDFDAIWTMIADVGGTEKPVGLAMGFWSHPKARTLVLDRLRWFPWASPRMRIESAVNFFNDVRREIPVVGFSRPKDKGFFEVLMRHGIIRQVGTSFNMFGDEPATVYETRWTQ